MSSLHAMIDGHAKQVLTFYHSFVCNNTLVFPLMNIAKVAIDQGIQAPIVLGLIITGLAFMEGRGMDGIRHDMGTDYIYTLMQNCKYPAAGCHRACRRTFGTNLCHCC